MVPSIKPDSVGTVHVACCLEGPLSSVVIIENMASELTESVKLIFKERKHKAS